MSECDGRMKKIDMTIYRKLVEIFITTFKINFILNFPQFSIINGQRNSSVNEVEDHTICLKTETKLVVHEVVIE